MQKGVTFYCDKLTRSKSKVIVEMVQNQPDDFLPEDMNLTVVLLIVKFADIMSNKLKIEFEKYF